MKRTNRRGAAARGATPASISSIPPRPGALSPSPALAQRNIELFRKLFVDERGAFLALLRLGGSGVAGADGGVGAAPAASGRAQLLAQRLYSCISSVIVGEADPRCVIAALEEFLLLDEVSCSRRRPLASLLRRRR